MIVMGVESSCDETSVSLVKDGKKVLSNEVLSQIDIHKAYGGVVPEIASREHVKGITMVFDQAIRKAGIEYKDIDLVAVTTGPGLIGSLLIGINAAKVVSLNYDIPLIGVQHIAGHIYANGIEHDMVFPLLALVVSGGHTELVLMRKHYEFEKLGETADD
ncbi:MAG TPA: tRNA (adenosine(37)-N6)-threonylcarbamoyltransferase complex transferase subunit TsaD, partial [Candidatus Izemoplasmatales bacterium]|nr:tRNA (adenosine(37)-N6)-threonylcarbamoyltransferase complex transferase subunit TsaD [Candidatus Izemoplasmatales bacterium]